MTKFRFQSILFFVAMALSGSAQAADPAQCVKGAKGTDAVNDCTAAITSGTLKGWDLAAVYLYRASGFQDLEKLDEAAADLNNATSLRNPYPEAIVAQVKLKVKLKERTSAAQALAADPKDCTPDVAAEVAVSACTSAIQKGSLTGTNLAEAYLDRASGYDYLGKYDEAMADFNQSVATDPNFARGYMWRGYFEMKIHKDELVLADFNKAIELKPDSAEPLLFRARYYYEAHGDWKNVVADMEKVVKLEPDDQNYANYLEHAQEEVKKQ